MADTDQEVEDDTEAAEGEEEEEADEAEDDPQQEPDQQDDDYEPPQRKPWSTREERAQFFKDKKGDKLKDKDDVDIAELIQQGVNKALAPVFDTLASREDETEIREVLREHPEWKRHEKKVRKEMKVYTNVPALKLFRAHAFDDAEATGADKAKKAETDAKKREVKGSGSRSKGADTAAPDFSKMTPEQFRKFNNEIKTGRKIKIEE